MKLKWYGTATLLIESGDTRILIDPYLRSFNKKLPPVPVDEATTAQAIFITHPHLDHFGDVAAFAKGNVRQIFVSENGIRLAEKHGMDTSRMLPLEANELHPVGGLTVRTYRSRHCKFDVATVLRVFFSPRTWALFGKGVRLLHGAGQYKLDGDIYALEISDGEKRVMVLGSAGLEDGVPYPQGADLLVFPYQGRAGMHRYMRKFLRVFQPKAVMLDHFDNAFPPLTHRVNTKKFLPTLRETLPGARGLEPVEGEWYEV